MRLGDLAAEPEAEPRRAGATRPAGEGVELRVDPRPVVRDVDDDPAVPLGHVELDARAVPQPVRDEVREHLAQTCRIAVHEGCTSDGDGNGVSLERRRERTEVDARPAQREELAVAEDPLDVARRREREQEEPPALVPRYRRRGLGERRERRDRAPQLVCDDLQTLARRGLWTWLQPCLSSSDGAPIDASARRAAARTAGSGSST